MIERITATPLSTLNHRHPSLLALLTSLSPSQLSSLQSMVARRAAGHPLQYLLGDTPFCSLSFLCRPPTLIPRPETEQMTDWLIHTLVGGARGGYEGSEGWPAGVELWEKRTTLSAGVEEGWRGLRVLDVCSGSGCIGLAMAAHLGCATVGVDIADSALTLARDNVAHLSQQLPSALTQSTFIAGDVLSSDFPALLSPWGSFDVLVSNPPYIPRAQLLSLQREIVEHEDPRALVGGEDGLAFYSALVGLAGKVVRRGKWRGPEVVVEIGGQEQVQAVKSACVKGGFSDVRVYEDHAGKPRWIAARRTKG